MHVEVESVSLKEIKMDFTLTFCLVNLRGGRQHFLCAEILFPRIKSAVPSPLKLTKQKVEALQANIRAEKLA